MSYLMGSVDGPTVRRTLSLKYPGAPIRFSEVMDTSALARWQSFVSDPMASVDPPNYSPRPGDGPPKWMLERGSLVGQGLAARPGPHEASARLRMKCFGDP